VRSIDTGGADALRVHPPSRSQSARAEEQADKEVRVAEADPEDNTGRGVNISPGRDMAEQEGRTEQFVPYAFYDHICGFKLSGETGQILSCIVRKTWCWNKNKDMIPLSQFQALSHMSKPHIQRTIDLLSEHKIISVSPESIAESGNTVKHPGKRDGHVYEINRDFASWVPFERQKSIAEPGNTPESEEKSIAEFGSLK